MNLELTILSEISQTEKDKSYISSLYVESKIQQTLKITKQEKTQYREQRNGYQ